MRSKCWIALVVLSSLGACRAIQNPNLPTAERLNDAQGKGPRVLAVVAHPDDEISFAGTMYKTASFLDGVCDVAVLTNGEGGFKYATLAESIYGHELTEETTGRAKLPAIRKRELQAGCRLLGVRNLYFFDQIDHRYTTDLVEVLGPDAKIWDLARIRLGLHTLMRTNEYDFVLTLAPTTTTHAHHQAATLLALEAASSLPEGERPIVLCRQPRSDEAVPAKATVAGFPPTRAHAAGLVFDRTQKFGHRQRLDYKIVVNWAIAEHKSQGTMQLLMGVGDDEAYLLFERNPADAVARAGRLFEQLAGQQFETREYAPSAGTNAAPSQ